MIRYFTKENDMVDWICWKHYGRQSGAVEEVYAVNPDLAEWGSYLPAGIIINLPDLSFDEVETKIRLWD